MKRAEAEGFTLIELLIVLAILGIIVLSLAPGLVEGLRRDARPAAQPTANPQKATVADIRNTGTAMFSWLTDQVGAAAAGETTTQVDLRDYPPITQADLATILVPTYLQAVPAADHWDHPYDYALNVSNPMAKEVMAIRSTGKDGVAEGDVYTVTGFDPTDYDRDIVWVDGFFVQWPQQR